MNFSNSNSRDIFIEKSQQKVSTLLIRALKVPPYLHKQPEVDEIYQIIEHIKDGSALFGLHEVGKVAILLLGNFNKNGHTYEFQDGRSDNLVEGLKRLGQALLAEGDLSSHKKLEIHKAYPIEKGNEMFTIDSATEISDFIANQRGEMSRLIEKEWIRFQRFQSYFCVLLIQLDSYGLSVQRHGREVVKKCLDTIYQSSQQTIRIYDEVKRWKADSILLLLPATRIEEAEIVGMRIESLIKTAPLDIEESMNIKIGAVESEHEYKIVMDMVSSLEKQLAATFVPEGVFCVPRIAQTQEKTSENERFKLLIVDDDPVASSIIQNHLDPEEWDISMCTEGRKALEAVLQIKPDFIISETKMDELDGYAFCSFIRQYSVTQHVVFMFLSRQTLDNHIIRGFQVGADDYVIKPFSMKEVEVRLKRYWTHRHHGREKVYD